MAYLNTLFDLMIDIVNQRQGNLNNALSDVKRGAFELKASRGRSQVA